MASEIGLDEPADRQSRERLFVRIRWAVVASWPVLLLPEIFSSKALEAGGVSLFAVAYAALAHRWVTGTAGRQSPWVGRALLAGDVAAVTGAWIATGGPESPLSPFLILVVLATAVRAGAPAALGAAALIGLIEAALAWREGFVGTSPFRWGTGSLVAALLGVLLRRADQARGASPSLEAADRFRLFLSVARSISAILDVGELLEAIVKAALRIVPARGAYLVLLSPSGETVERIAASAGLDRPAADAIDLRGDFFEEVRRQGAVIQTREHRREALAAGDLRTQADRGVVALSLRRRQPVGFLVVIDPHEGPDPPREALEVLSAVAEQAAVTIENARLFEGLVRERQRKQELLWRLLHAEEEERKRIAGYLHDQLGRRLFELHYGLRQCQEQIGESDPLICEILARLDGEARRCGDEIRAIMNELRPAVLDDFGFPEALQEFVASLQARGEFTQVQLEIDRNAAVADREAHLVLFRVLEEAVLNVRKHASARRLWIRFGPMGPRHAGLVVRDDGVGFEPSAIPPGHLGLLYMRERMEAVGGSLEVRSRPGQGTEVVARVPSVESRVDERVSG